MLESNNRTCKGNENLETLQALACLIWLPTNAMRDALSYTIHIHNRYS